MKPFIKDSTVNILESARNIIAMLEIKIGIDN